MKIIKTIAGAVVGGLIATFLCWGLLILYAKFVLHGQGSLFDTHPNVANAFFITWGVVSVIFILFGASITARAFPERTR